MDANLFAFVPAAVVAGCGVMALGWKISKAPVGYEDASGFSHEPSPPPMSPPCALDWGAMVEIVHDRTGETIGVSRHRLHDYHAGVRLVETLDGRRVFALPNGRAPGTSYRVRNIAPLVLTPDQAAVLRHMSGEFAYPAAVLAADAGLPEKTVTKARKELRGLGLVDYGTLRSEGGEGYHVAGRGYWLTKAGLAEQRRLHAAQRDEVIDCRWQPELAVEA